MVCIGLQKCHSGDLNWTNINTYLPAHSLMYLFCEIWETLPGKNQESLFTLSYRAISDILSASCWLPLTLRNTTINSSNARFPSSISLTLSFQLKSNSILSLKNTHLLTEQLAQIVIQQRLDEKVLKFQEAYLARKSQSAYVYGTVLPKARLFWVPHLPMHDICSHIWIFPGQTHKTTPIWIHFIEYSPSLFILPLNTQSNMSILVQRTMHNVPETESFVLLLPL